MTLLLRVFGVALASLVALFVLRGSASGFSALVKVGALLLIFGMVLPELASGVDSLHSLVLGFVEEDSFIGTSISVMVKALGIALLGRICADVCKECGEGGLAEGVEVASGIVIFSLSLPILFDILTFASDVLQRGA